MSAPTNLINSEWQETYTYPGLTVVNCWASWCIHSQNIIPLVDRLAEEYKDRIKVIKLNIDENPKMASELGLLGINSIPVTFIFKAGKCIDKISGNASYEVFHAAIYKHLRDNRSMY
jgi:thioredoxin 1